MKIRTKLLMAFSALIVLMAVVFYSISHGYLMVMFRTYAKTAQQSQADQWAELLAYHYQANHDTWRGTESFIQDILSQHQGTQANHVDRVSVHTEPAQQLISGQDTDQDDTGTQADKNDDNSSSSPIIVNGQHVGIVTVVDEGQKGLYVAAKRILQWMTWTTFIGVLSTSVIAFLISLWLTSLITGPLKRLLSAMELTVKGEKEARVHIPRDDEFGRVGQAFNAMTERWHKTDEARKRLVADVAHELRTPLAVMQGHLELVQEGMASLDEGTVLRVLDEVMRLSRLVDDLHQLSLAEVGMLPLHKTDTDLCSLVQHVVDNFAWEAEEQRVSLQLNLPTKPVLRYVDAHRITQVIVNLVGNALHYTPRTGTVSVSLIVATAGVRLVVRDTGKGIAKQDLPLVFDRFYRVNEARSRNTGGMGIGLAIAKEYVELHGGQIEIDSELGKGTVFTVVLPNATSLDSR